MTDRLPQQKTIGLIGGMSWESTQTYYQLINQGIRNKLGKLHSAQIAMVSLDFEPIERCQKQEDWNGAAKILAEAAKKVEAAGADFVLICTNTMHKVFEQVENSLTIPLMHIADATGHQLAKDGITKVGLLGTAFTMEQAFYKQRLVDKFGIEVVVPKEVERAAVHHVIYDELCLGLIKAESKQRFVNIINKLHDDGAQAVILGCTEIGLLVQKQDTQVPIYDTAEIHGNAAVGQALAT